MKEEKKILRKFSPENADFSPRKMLMEFLNFDLDSIDLERLNEKFFLLRFDNEAQAKELQAEIQRDLLPIISPVKMPDAAEAYELIHRLVQKINKMDLRPIWVVTPVDYDFYWYNKDLKTGKRILHARKKPPLVTIKWGKILKILNARWIIHVAPERIPLRSLRDYFYGVILSTLEDGELSTFRRCSECKKFFIAEDPKCKYCSTKCAEAADRRSAAKKRVPKYRQEKRKKKEKEARQAADRKALRQFSEFMKLASKSRHTDEELSKLRPKLKALGQGDMQKGWKVVRKLERQPVQDAWKSLPVDVKNPFKEEATAEAWA